MSGYPYGNDWILLLRVKTKIAHLNSTTATPSRISCITSGGSPDVKWYYFRVFRIESSLSPYVVVMVECKGSPRLEQCLL